MIGYTATHCMEGIGGGGVALQGVVERALHLQACLDGVKGVWADGSGCGLVISAPAHM